MMGVAKTSRAARGLLLAGLLAAGAALAVPAGQAFAQSSEIAIVVNNQAITTMDVQRRAAFLRLQRTSGNLNDQAREQLINESIQLQEARRVNAVVSDEQVEQSLQRFAQGNNLTQAQLEQVLGQAGVGVEHFRNYIRAQMSWPRVVQARYASQQSNTQQDLVARMLERGADQPTTTEYILQQIIFVVPEARRNELGQRQREAEQMRARFTNCESSRQFAAGLRDVSVRDLGRVMQPQLPSEWREQVMATEPGRTTAVRTTDRGAEFLAVCSAQQVSDDLAAEMVFREEEQEGGAMQERADEFLAELKAQASISYR